MPFSLKPDYEKVKARYDAFWHREIIDRPPVSITLPGKPLPPLAHRSYASQEERWLDIAYRAEAIDRGMRSTRWLYDALPVAWPNLGPEIFSAWCGCGYAYGEDTTWSKPVIDDWEEDAGKARLDMQHPLFKKTVAFTKLLLEYGQGHYIVGLSDLHPGGDHLAALRDPQQLAMDMIDNPDHVKRMLDRSMPEYYAAYGVFYHMLREAGMPISSWTPLIHDGTFYIPSNDFSCMISKAAFDDMFLEGIRQECRFYERSIYHLDGPDALRHLDSLLGIEELDAVQWVCGAGREGYRRWIPVYQKIQAAGKGIQMMCHADELPLIFDTLQPEGIWFSSIAGISGDEEAKAVVDRITRWA